MNLPYVTKSVEENTDHLKDIIKQQQAEIYRLKNIIDNLPGSIYWKDSNGVYLGRNAYSHEKSKSVHIEDDSSSQDSPIGKTDYDYFTKEVADAYRKHDVEAMTTKAEVIREEVAQLPGGEEIIQLSSKKPLYNEKGDVVGIVGNTVDITYLKSIEAGLREAKNQAEITNQAIALMAASIAHELRTPLASLGLSMTILAKHLLRLLAASQDQKFHFSEMSPLNLEILRQKCSNPTQEVEYANLVIDMFLMKIRELDPSSHDSEICSISDCIQTALNRYPLSNGELELIKWDNDYDFNFSGNKILMTHILFNLLKNAIYYIKAADRGKIFIWQEKGLNKNRLFFKDTAQGISADILPSIFDKFFSKTPQGCGVGLSFCKMVMKNLGGDIRCHSIEGEYTEFVLEFPVCDH